MAPNTENSTMHDSTTIPSSGTEFASFIGVDLHKRTVTLVAVGPEGQPLGQLKIDTKCVDRI